MRGGRNPVSNVAAPAARRPAGLRLGCAGSIENSPAQGEDDSRNRRVCKTVGATTTYYLYDLESRLIAELAGSGRVLERIRLAGAGACGASGIRTPAGAVLLHQRSPGHAAAVDKCERYNSPTIRPPPCPLAGPRFNSARCGTTCASRASTLMPRPGCITIGTDFMIQKRDGIYPLILLGLLAG